MNTSETLQQMQQLRLQVCTVLITRNWNSYGCQYDFMDGFAKHMRDALPNAYFIGFT